MLNKIFFKKIHINFVEGFLVELNTFLGLAMPNQSCHKIKLIIISRWFLGDILGLEIPSLHYPYIATVLLKSTVRKIN